MHKRNADKASEPIPSINPEHYVKVTKMNHIVQVQHMEKQNRKQHIKKLDKDTYVDIATGEIKTFEHSLNRKENYNSLRQTFKKLRYLINNNYTGNPNELHVTLTYKENMTDTKRLYTDYEKFIKKLKYKYHKQTTIDYLSVIEPQERGAWHCHVLLRFNDLDTIYIKNPDLRQMWGNGFVTIKSLKDVDNIGAYLSAYLADIELKEGDSRNDHQEVTTKIVDGKEKKFIKGGRLHMYPPGMNLYRKSKGIIFPEHQEIAFKHIKKVVGSAKPHYGKQITVQDGEYSNTITYLDYNTKRNQTK